MTTVQLAADVRIARSIGDVRAFFAEVDNLARWDRSVVKVVRRTDDPLAPGRELSTLGPAKPGRQGRVSAYRITEVADDHVSVALLDDSVFEKAEWITRFAPTSTGLETDVRVEVSALPRPRYFFFRWLLPLLGQGIADDLYFLKRAIEHGEIAKR